EQLRETAERRREIRPRRDARYVADIAVARIDTQRLRRKRRLTIRAIPGQSGRARNHHPAGESDGDRRSDGDLHGHRHGHGTSELPVAEERHGDWRSHRRQLHHTRHHRCRQRRPVHGRRQQRRRQHDQRRRRSHGDILANRPAALTFAPFPRPPRPTTQPASQMVTADQTATFTVTATGTAPLSYQWQRNGTAIGGATAASYTTPATTAADNGDQFTVVVSNAAGSMTSDAAVLTVTSWPTAPQLSPSLPSRAPPDPRPSRRVRW